MITRNGTVIAAFQNRRHAREALDALEQVGFRDDQLGFALRGEDVKRGGMLTDATGAKDAEGAVKGFLAGGLTGGVLAAAAALMIPGIGPVVAGGFLATVLGGAAAGAATGGIFGAMAGLELSEDEAQFYDREFRSGCAIVTVKAGDRVDEAVRILRRHGGYSAEARDSAPDEPKYDPGMTNDYLG
jgi:hypothetical protein